MPFGLDIKSIVVGVVLALFVWPLVQRTISGARNGAAAS